MSRLPRLESDEDFRKSDRSFTDGSLGEPHGSGVRTHAPGSSDAVAADLDVLSDRPGSDARDRSAPPRSGPPEPASSVGVLENPVVSPGNPPYHLVKGGAVQERITEEQCGLTTKPRRDYECGTFETVSPFSEWVGGPPDSVNVLYADPSRTLAEEAVSPRRVMIHPS